MTFNDIIMWVVAIGVIIGGIDFMLGNKFGLGGKFEDGLMFFKIDDGTLYCSECQYSGAIPIDRTILDSMRHIVYSEFDKLYSFDIPDDAAKRLTDVTEKYILYQSEHRFPTLDFYHSIEVI